MSDSSPLKSFSKGRSDMDEEKSDIASREPRDEEKSDKTSRERREEQRNYRILRERRERNRSSSPRDDRYRSSRSQSKSPRKIVTRSRSPRRDTNQSTRSRSYSRSPVRSNVNSNKDEANPEDEEDRIEPEKPNFGLTGMLAAETNTFNGVVVNYNEPPEAHRPVEKWRWYVFKGDQQIDELMLHRQSAYLIGRDRAVTDIPMDHPSISKQHAVLQYRKVNEKDPITNTTKAVIKPYLIDLNTTNGTFVNGTLLPKQRYYELKSKDVLKFAGSTRDYVLMSDQQP